jgi:hypothetical protein
MNRVSFEEACKVGKTIVTSESLREFGVKKTMELYNEELKKTGWTLEEILKESRDRMILKIQIFKLEDKP